jgi:hypothetical protein
MPDIKLKTQNTEPGDVFPPPPPGTATRNLPARPCLQGFIQEFITTSTFYCELTLFYWRPGLLSYVSLTGGNIREITRYRRSHNLYQLRYEVTSHVADGDYEVPLVFPWTTDTTILKPQVFASLCSGVPTLLEKQYLTTVFGGLTMLPMFFLYQSYRSLINNDPLAS